MRTVFFIALLGLVLALASPVLAAEASGASAGGKVQQSLAKTAPPDSPAKGESRSTSVVVMHTGSDSIGSRLATRLKEAFNASNLFKLEEKDTPKMRLLLSTMPEFPSRPGAGSIYSLTWVFSQSDGHLGYLLDRELGVLTPDGVDALVYSVLERTDGIGVKYGYLFK